MDRALWFREGVLRLALGAYRNIDLKTPIDKVAQAADKIGEL
jgi:hypothetical protein